MENNNWIPVSSGIFPDDMEDVQVTFIGYNDHAPHCEALLIETMKNGIGH